LSKIFKASFISTSSEKVVLEVSAPPKLQTVELQQKLQESEKNFEAREKAEKEAQTIISDAEEIAQKILLEANQQAEQQKEQALQDIEQWWQSKQLELQQLMEQVREEAYQEGMRQGVEDGHRAALEEEQQNVQTARDVLALAYQQKEKIIAEAEPFLVELSVEIARKIVGDELSTAPDKILTIAKKALRRSRVHGEITLCVNHRYFPYIEEHRGQFMEILEGQAELSIYPDHAVQDEGCVIRTPFGSVDARIDTQLAEIKQVLLDIARRSEADGHS